MYNISISSTGSKPKPHLCGLISRPLHYSKLLWYDKNSWLWLESFLIRRDPSTEFEKRAMQTSQAYTPILGI